MANWFVFTQGNRKIVIDLNKIDRITIEEPGPSETNLWTVKLNDSESFKLDSDQISKLAAALGIPAIDTI